jgi:formate dehydrogenase
MSETARLAHYVLPAASQFEKAEATFFNFDFPENYFHLRPRLLPPPPGVLPEAEIHARLALALGAITENDLARLHAAAAAGPEAYAEAVLGGVMGDARLQHQVPVLLYRTMPLPPEVREGAIVFALALRAATQSPAPLARAGFGGSPFEAAQALFGALLEKPWGVVFAVDTWDEVLARIATSDGKIHLALPDLLDELGKLPTSPVGADSAFPFLLSAGERRSFTANTIIRDPAWRTRDPGGALRMSPADAAVLGVRTGDRLRLSTRRDSAVVGIEVSDTMQPGHLSLPNGLGLVYPADGTSVRTGVAPNELTAAEDRDRFVGTPWHKSVPARLERV